MDIFKDDDTVEEIASEPCQNDEIDALLEKDDCLGYLDKALKKLEGKGRKSRFISGLIGGFDTFGTVGEILYRGYAQKKHKGIIGAHSEDYYTVGLKAAARVDRDGGKAYATGVGVGCVLGISAAVITSGVSILGTQAVGLGNKIHEKIKRRRNTEEY